jgi:hypothetical protein
MPKNQEGGSSDYMHSFYSSTALGGAAAISQATLAGINQAPMFNPLSGTAAIPGTSTGIIPSGLYLASTQSGGGCKQHAKQLGGMSTEQLRDQCNENGISCRGEKGGYKHRSTLIQQLAGAFTGLYAPQPGSNQPGLHSF